MTAAVETRPHTHAWRLVGVDFDSGDPVQQFECECGDSWFR